LTQLQIIPETISKRCEWAQKDLALKQTEVLIADFAEEFPQFLQMGSL